MDEKRVFDWSQKPNVSKNLIKKVDDQDDANLRRALTEVVDAIND